MGEAFLDYKKGGSSGLDINGLIEDYYVYAGENVNAGDFVEFINGIASKIDYGTSTDTSIIATNKYGRIISACKLADNKVFIAHGTAYGTSADQLYGIVCMIDGATITYGTDRVLCTESYSANCISAVALSPTNVFIAHSCNSNKYLYGTVCTINGIVVSKGTSYSLSSTNQTGFAISATKLPNSKVFIAHSYDANNHLYGMIVTINGTKITKGTDTQLSKVAQSGFCISTELLPNGNVFIAHNYSANYYLYALVCAIDGTTITSGTDTKLSSTSYTGRAISLDKINSDKVFISHENANSLYGIVCSISDTTISAGTDTHIFNYTTTTDSSTLTVGTDKVLVIGINNTTEYKMFGVTCDINDLTITKNTPKIMNSSPYTGWLTSPVLLGDTIFVAHSHTQNSLYLYAQMFGIVNNQPSSQVIATKYERQVRPATTLPCNGVASTSGKGGDSTGHKDMVSVYRLPMINLIANGDFNNGLEGWETSSAYATISLEDGCLKTVSTYSNTSATSVFTQAYYTVPKAIAGHKYYWRLKVKPTRISQGTLKLVLWVTYYIDLNVSVNSTWQSFSGIHEVDTPIESETYKRIGFSLNKPGVNDTIYWDDIAMYDLTAMFGTGYEPTQEWCDANL